MSKNFFERVIIFTDIHLGLKRNSPLHNQDCLEFLDWMIDLAKKEGITTCFFLGDWHHSRHTLNIETLNYSWKGLKKLNEAFEHVYFLIGNHDLYLKDSREISSVVFTEEFPNIHLIDEKFTKGNVTFYPWLVEDEWKEVKKCQSKYIFGHFEIPEFYLNAMVKMPDNGEIQYDDFDKQSYVFTGHFHKRQWKNNVCYMGNAFPHDFNDLNDDERGCMILEWGNEPEFHKWPHAPVYRSYKYDDLKDDPSVLDDLTKANVKIEYDENSISHVDITEFRDTIKENYDIRTIKLIENSKKELFEGEEVDEANVCDNVDKIVVGQLKTIDTNEYDVNMLIRMYEDL